jgi:hypothetical protein
MGPAPFFWPKKRFGLAQKQLEMSRLQVVTLPG